MEFLVISRAVDSANVPPQVTVALAKQTFQMLKANKEPRIKALYPYAGERAGAFVVEASRATSSKKSSLSATFRNQLQRNPCARHTGCGIEDRGCSRATHCADDAYRSSLARR